MAQSTPEIHFLGLRHEPCQGFAPGPHWGGGAYSAPPPPQTPQLLVTSYARLQCAARVA